jgi:glycosyltransferase involved in cell wall biosynthesis
MKHFVFISPIPPPMHGAAFASQLFLDSVPNEEICIHHINAKFVTRVEELQSFSFKKVFLLVRYISQLKILLLTKRIDAVILTPAFFRNPFLKDSLFILTARFFRVPVIAWCHMNFGRMELEQQSSAIQRYVQFILTCCEKFVCVSQLARQQFPDTLPDKKFAVVHNGLPNNDYSRIEETSNRKVTVVYLSNMAEAKGWRDVFAAAQNLCRTHENICFEFHGSPTADYSQREIEQLFASTSFPERITFHGYADTEQKQDALTRADIFCFPSHDETFGLVVLEAMQMQLPVVATNVGAVATMLNTEKLSHKHCIVPPREVQILESALEQYINSGSLRQKDGATNRQYFQRHFSLQAFARNWRTILSS